MATKSKKSSAKRSPAQKAATRKMVAANRAAAKARKSEGKKANAAKKSAKAPARKPAPPRSIGARVATLEGEVQDLRRDVDDHTGLFSYMKAHSKGLFSPSKAKG